MRKRFRIMGVFLDNKSLLIIGESLSQIGITLLFFFSGLVLLESLVFVISRNVFKMKNPLVPMLLAPAVAGMLILTLYPLFYSLVLSTSNMNLHHFKNPDYSLVIWWNNLKRVFSRPILRETYIYPIFLRTCIWSISQVSLQFILALTLALCLNLPIRFKMLFKGILILPWAVPEIIAILAWRGEFHYTYGAINQVLTILFGEGAAIHWMTTPFWNYFAMTIVNQWLGFPFLMIIILSSLQGIPNELYEAADLAGATGWMKLWNIKLPLIRPVVTPTILLILTGNFVSFNIPFLMNQNNLETADLLATALFRTAFVFNQYGFSASFSWVVTVFLFLLSFVFIRKTNALKGVTE